MIEDCGFESLASPALVELILIPLVVLTLAEWRMFFYRVDLALLVVVVVRGVVADLTIASFLQSSR